MARRPPHRRPPVETRPTRDLYDIVAYRENGTPIRVVDRAIETFRLGGSLPDVAMRCGIGRDIIHDWIRRGTAVSADIYGGRRTVDDLTRHERKCFDFVQLTAQAEADGKVYLLGLAEKLSAGGFVIETVTEKVERQDDGTEVVLERTRKRSTAAPDGSMIRWRLKTRWPNEFGDRHALELTGPDGGPVQLEATPIIDRLLDELDRIAENTATADTLLAGVQRPAIDTTATDTTPADTPQP